MLTTVLPALLALATSAPSAPTTPDAYGARWYPSDHGPVLTDVRRDALALRAPHEADVEALSRAAEAALVEVQRKTAGAGWVGLGQPVFRLTEHGLFVVELDGALSEAALRQLAERLAETPSVARVYPVLGRQHGRAFYDDRLVLTARPGRLDEALAAALPKVDGRLLRRSKVPHTALVEVGPALGHDAVRAAQLLEEAGVDALRVAQPDLYRELALTSDDPLYSEQWHLSRDEVEGIPGDAEIDAPGAWETTTGSHDVIVAVFDSGTDIAHPDLAPNVVDGFDGLTGDDDPSPACGSQPNNTEPTDSCPDDAPYLDAHGTAVSGLVAAKGDNQIGGSGVCPGCALMPVRLIGASAPSGLTTAEMFVEAVDRGADVINNSWGPGRSIFFPLSAAVEDAFAYARTEGRGGLGAVILFASGNDTSDVRLHPYANHHETIAVAASSNLDDFAIYSNYGLAIDVAAPSQGGVVEDDAFGLVTTDVSGEDGYTEGDSHDGFGGTSGASPVAAGVAALVVAAAPDLTADQVRLAMTSSAEKILADKIDWPAVVGQDLEAAMAYDERGHSIGFGFGRVNAAAAVEAAATIGALGAACTEDGEGCFCNSRGRCETPCAEQGDCLDGSTCELGRCQLPLPSPTDIGQPCSAACSTCVTAVDTDFEPQSVCTATCASDDECPSGFDCRVVDDSGLAICAVGDREAGNAHYAFNCRNDFYGSRIVVAGDDGQLYCSDLCYTDEPGACPYGFHCGAANCECTQQGRFGCRQVTCAENNFGNSNWPTPMCFPDEGYGVECASDLDCAFGDYCDPDGACRVDDREGCTTCDVCTDDEECGPNSFCYASQNDAASGHCTRFCTEDSDCDGDNTVCRPVDIGWTDINLCGSPSAFISENEVCVGDPGFQCTLACREDVPCPHGETCEEGECVPADFTKGEPEYIHFPTAAPEPEPETCACVSAADAAGPMAGLLLLGLGFPLRRRRS